MDAGAGGLVHCTGLDPVGQRDRRGRSGDAGGLGEDGPLVGHVADGVLAEHGVEGGIGEGQGGGVALADLDTGLQARVGHAGPGGVHVALHQVDAGDPQAVRGGQPHRRAAEAAADVEHMLSFRGARLDGGLRHATFRHQAVGAVGAAQRQEAFGIEPLDQRRAERAVVGFQRLLQALVRGGGDGAVSSSWAGSGNRKGTGARGGGQIWGRSTPPPATPRPTVISAKAGTHA